MNNQDAVHSAIAQEVKREFRLLCAEALQPLLDDFCDENYPFLLLLNDPTGVGTLVDALEYIATYFRGMRQKMEAEFAKETPPEDVANMKQFLTDAIAAIITTSLPDREDEEDDAVARLLQQFQGRESSRDGLQ